MLNAQCPPPRGMQLSSPGEGLRVFRGIAGGRGRVQKCLRTHERIAVGALERFLGEMSDQRADVVLDHDVLVHRCGVRVCVR